jgi:hypothetical protein
MWKMISLEDDDDEEPIQKGSHKILMKYISLSFVPCLCDFESIQHVIIQL